MAFSKNNPYLAVACDDFFILDPSQAKSDPDAHNSRGSDDNNLRNGFGASLFRYAKMVQGYDPISGQSQNISPARQLMKTTLTRWMADFHIDGLRLDSIENVQNWDFIQEYKDMARALNQQRFAAQGVGGADERFLVVGEELTEPHALLQQQRLDGLWHQSFKDYVRMALLGHNHENEATFEMTVRKAIDCRQFGYTDLTQAVIYLTSHDVEGFRNERLFNFFMNSGVADAEKRMKLAFVCLLTAVGVPMLLAGDDLQTSTISLTPMATSPRTKASRLTPSTSPASATTGAHGSRNTSPALSTCAPRMTPSPSMTRTSFTSISTTASACWSGAAANPMRTNRLS
jgi:glycosidase